MLIQVQTDRNIEGGTPLSTAVEAVVQEVLGRFSDRITRVEVHLSDVNGAKGGRDIRCVMEARVAGSPPMAVDEQAESVDAAARGAVARLERVLDTHLERIRGH